MNRPGKMDGSDELDVPEEFGGSEDFAIWTDRGPNRPDKLEAAGCWRDRTDRTAWRNLTDRMDWAA